MLPQVRIVSAQGSSLHVLNIMRYAQVVNYIVTGILFNDLESKCHLHEVLCARNIQGTKFFPCWLRETYLKKNMCSHIPLLTTLFMCLVWRPPLLLTNCYIHSPSTLVTDFSICSPIYVLFYVPDPQPLKILRWHSKIPICCRLNLAFINKTLPVVKKKLLQYSSRVFPVMEAAFWGVQYLLNRNSNMDRRTKDAFKWYM